MIIIRKTVFVLLACLLIFSVQSPDVSATNHYYLIQQQQATQRAMEAQRQAAAARRMQEQNRQVRETQRRDQEARRAQGRQAAERAREVQRRAAETRRIQQNRIRETRKIQQDQKQKTIKGQQQRQLQRAANDNKLKSDRLRKLVHNKKKRDNQRHNTKKAEERQKKSNLALLAIRGLQEKGYGTKGAGNIATAPKLKEQLQLESARSPFSSSGKLTEEAIQNSRKIIDSSKIRNPNIPKNFSKYSTKTFQSPSGNFQAHFYRNDKTGEVFYDQDYKSVFNAMSGK